MASPFTSLFTNQLDFQQSNQTYRGRFAPSPSGPLHLGSLVAALASYLQAKSQDGLWFVRIEDIDKPREQAGAKTQILDALEAFGMNWDRDANTESDLIPEDRNCLVQTHRLERYLAIFEQMRSSGMLYACQCSRKQIRAHGGLYPGTCRELALPFENNAIRLKQTTPILEFVDGLFQRVEIAPEFAGEDYILKRRDGLFAYQLVVVIDDIDQGITEVVRGADIMTLTPRQLSLYQLLGFPAPNFVHLPLLVEKPGFKLSKQNHAAPINVTDPKQELLTAMGLLGLPLFDELNDLSIPQLIDWGVSHWQLAHVPQKEELLV